LAAVPALNWPMKKPLIWLALPALLAGCVAPETTTVDTGRRLLDTLPGNARLAEVEADLLATARDRYGDTRIDRALAMPDYLVAKRFVGMAPPPPPGAGAAWRPPTPSALLSKQSGRWLVATPDGWREANREAAAEIDTLLASSDFWNEPATVPACPDFGASNLLLKAPGKARTVRSHQCSSATTRVIEAAFRA
jgi:hypothetical protein